jgi:hypothetical protein
MSVTVWTAGLLTAVQAPIVWAPSDITTALGGILTGLAWSSVGLWLYFLKDQPTFYAQRNLIQAAAIAVLLTQGVWLQASWVSVASGYLAIKALIGLSFPKKLEPTSTGWPHHMGPIATSGVVILTVSWLLVTTFFPAWAMGLLIAKPAVISVYGLALIGYAFATFRLFFGPISTPSVGLTGWGLITGLDVLLYAAALLSTLQPFSLENANANSVLSIALLVLLAHVVVLTCIEQWKRCIGSFQIKRHHHTAHQQLHVDLAVKTIQLE